MGGECEVFGKVVYETHDAKSVYYSPARLIFVTGFYGYGKTVGIGGYVICKAREKGEKYLYINLRSLKDHAQDFPISEIKIGSLSEIFRILYDFVENKKELSNIEGIETNISDLTNRISNINNFNNIIDLYKSAFGDFSTKLYIIFDEIESVAPDLESAIASLCREARALYDRGFNFKIIALIQEAELVKRRIDRADCVGTDAGGAPGIASEHRLRGYRAEDYLRLLAGLKGNDKEKKKMAENLATLPPRLVFEILDSHRPSSVQELENILMSAISGRREELFLKTPTEEDTDEMANEFLNELKRKYPSTRLLKGDYKVYPYEIVCEKAKVKLCLDLRTVQRKETSCDVVIRRHGKNMQIIMRNKSTLIDTPFSHFLAAFSHRRPIFGGLDEYYMNIREVVISNIVSSLPCQ